MELRTIWTFVAGLGMIALACVGTYLTSRLPVLVPTPEGAIKWTDAVQAISAATTAAFTLVLLVVSVRQWKVGEAAARASLTAADVARATLIASHRPMLSYDVKDVVILPVGAVGNKLGHRVWAAEITIANLGDTVCSIERVSVRSTSFLPHPGATNRPYPRSPGPWARKGPFSSVFENLIKKVEPLRPGSSITLNASEPFYEAEGYVKDDSLSIIYAFILITHVDGLGIKREQAVTYLTFDMDPVSADRIHAADYDFTDLLHLGDLNDAVPR